MKMIEVVSSNVVAVGYEDNNLYVDYKSGSYVYKDVPEEIYNALLNAESKGKFMWAKVKGKYDYCKIEGERHYAQTN